MGRRLVRCSSFSLAGTNSDSRGDAEDAFGGEGEHEAGDTAEDHADADECADDPDGAGGPGAPDHDGQNEGDDAVDQKPDCAVAGAKLEVLDELDDGLEEEVVRKDEGEDEQAVEGMHEEDEAGEQVDGADEYLPDTAARGVGLEGEDEVGDATEYHGPAEDEGDGEAGDRWDEDGEEPGDDEEDAEGDGPVDGFGDECGEGGWGCAHERPPEVVDTGPRVGRRIS